MRPLPLIVHAGGPYFDDAIRCATGISSDSTTRTTPAGCSYSKTASNPTSTGTVTLAVSMNAAADNKADGIWGMGMVTMAGFAGMLAL